VRACKRIDVPFVGTHVMCSTLGALHMATIASISDDRHVVDIEYPFEPIVAMAAAEQLRLGGEGGVLLGTDALLSATRNQLISVGDCGTGAAR
jgi:hypothetical protein